LPDIGIVYEVAMLKHTQAGVTLIELMIGMLIGLFVTGGVISVYIAVAESSAQTLKQSRLNQEMSAIMNVMTNDIRRAGYWDAAGKGKPQDNPYMGFDATDHDAKTYALQVRDASNNFAGEQGSGSCIIYTYDSDPDTANTSVNDNDRFGFRLDGAELKMKTGGTTNDCTSPTWETVNDVNSITVTGLTFDLGNSTCINNSEPDEQDDSDPADGVVDSADEIDCFVITPDSGEVMTVVREVKITLDAQLAADSLVRASMSQTVRVRNDLVRVQP
jgi:type IV pilus assembly protein PilW